jgi:tRNA A37 threonylcarbamoyladenosine dehydratase
MPVDTFFELNFAQGDIMQDNLPPASEQYDQRFGGTRRLYGNSEVEILRASHVCVVGIGGVGSWAVEALARTGIGELTLIDMDDVCVTNINRQIHALNGTVGQSKIEVMAERVKLMNPECKVNLIDDFMSPDNLKECISKDFDYVLDAIDSGRVKTHGLCQRFWCGNGSDRHLWLCCCITSR